MPSLLYPKSRVTQKALLALTVPPGWTRNSLGWSHTHTLIPAAFPAQGQRPPTPIQMIWGQGPEKRRACFVLSLPPLIGDGKVDRCNPKNGFSVVGVDGFQNDNRGLLGSEQANEGFRVCLSKVVCLRRKPIYVLSHCSPML